MRPSIIKCQMAGKPKEKTKEEIQAEMKEKGSAGNLIIV